jgi:hypothetical protein
MHTPNNDPQASKPTTAPRLLWLVRAVLIAAIAVVAGQLTWQAWQLTRPSPAATQALTFDDDAPATDLWTALLNSPGYWAVDGMNIAVRFASVSPAEREERFRCDAAAPSGTPAPWEEVVNRWIVKEFAPEARPRGDFVEHFGSRAGVFVRYVSTSAPDARPCLAQVAWEHEDGMWGLLEAIPVSEAAASPPAEPLLPLPGESVVARRYSSRGKLTGEVYRWSDSAGDPVENWTAHGCRVLSRDDRDGLAVKQIANASGDRYLVLQLTGKENHGLLVVRVHDALCAVAGMS